MFSREKQIPSEFSLFFFFFFFGPVSSGNCDEHGRNEYSTVFCTGHVQSIVIRCDQLLRKWRSTTSHMI